MSLAAFITSAAPASRLPCWTLIPSKVMSIS
jgi:hypothetical protein